MSYTEITAFWPGEKAEIIEELRNSHGTEPVIFGFMTENYLGAPRSSWLFDSERIWPLWSKKTIPIHQRAVLMFTYDLHYVSKKDYKRFAADIKLFLQDLGEDPSRVNHWPRICEIFESDPDYPAIAINTSLSENQYLGEYDEESDNYIPVDASQCGDIYEALDDLLKQEPSCK